MQSSGPQRSPRPARSSASGFSSSAEPAPSTSRTGSSSETGIGTTGSGGSGGEAGAASVSAGQSPVGRVGAGGASRAANLPVERTRLSQMIETRRSQESQMRANPGALGGPGGRVSPQHVVPPVVGQPFHRSVSDTPRVTPQHGVQILRSPALVTSVSHPSPGLGGGASGAQVVRGAVQTPARAPAQSPESSTPVEPRVTISTNTDGPVGYLRMFFLVLEQTPMI